MDQKIVPLSKLIEQFERLPGIGRKSAQRLAFHVLDMSDTQVNTFAKTILEAHEKIHYCRICCNLTDKDVCSVCENGARNTEIICVVEDSRDVFAIEKTHEFNGTYHVLHGVISPLNGIGPENLTVKELLSRLSNENVKEIIMATNPTVEGEATAMYISRLIKPLGIAVSRLAYGIPVGANLEYADEVTLSKALEGRKII